MTTNFDLVQCVCVFTYLCFAQLIWFSPKALKIKHNKCTHDHPFEYMSIDMIFG